MEYIETSGRPTKTGWSAFIPFFLALFIGVAGVVSAQQAALSELDATLQMLYQQYQSQWKGRTGAELRADPALKSLQEMIPIDLSTGEPVVSVAVTVDDQGQGLMRGGFQVESQ